MLPSSSMVGGVVRFSSPVMVAAVRSSTTAIPAATRAAAVSRIKVTVQTNRVGLMGEYHFLLTSFILL